MCSSCYKGMGLFSTAAPEKGNVLFCHALAVVDILKQFAIVMIIFNLGTKFTYLMYLCLALSVIGLSIMSPLLYHDIWISFIPPSEMTVETILVSIERVLQRVKKWLFARTMRVIFVHTALPVGNGRMMLFTSWLSQTLVEMMSRKRSIIQIPKDEYTMCCALVIVVSLMCWDHVF